MNADEGGGCLSLVLLTIFLCLWFIAEVTSSNDAAQDRPGCSCSELEPS